MKLTKLRNIRSFLPLPSFHLLSSFPISIPFPNDHDDQTTTLMTMITPLAFTTASLFSYSPPLNGEIPYDRVYPSKTVPLTNVIRQPHHTIIHDLRPLLNAGNANQTSINTTGFQILPKSIAKTTMTETDFLDDDLIRTKYYTETIDLFKKVTGAHRVIIFDHTVRFTPVFIH